MKNEKWDDVHGNTTPDDRMVAFLESPTDSYAILQLREDVDDNIPLMFANYSYLWCSWSRSARLTSAELIIT